MKPLQIAVIGAGHLGRIHAKLIGQVDGAELAAICDPVEEARSIASTQFQCEVVGDFRGVLPKVDAVVVAAPTDRHHEIVKTVLKSGKHVLVEKPLTNDATDARRLAMLASAKRLTLQVGHVERFNPAFTELGELAENVKYVEAVRASSFPGRCLDVGVVLDLMIHDLDLVLSLTDAPVTGISATGLAVVSGHEDVAEARLEFECGLVSHLKASRISPQPARTMQLYGGGGFADVDFGKPSLTVLRPSEAVASRIFDLNTEIPDPLGCGPELFANHLPVRSLELEPRNAILDELHDFVISIRSGVAPTVDGAAGARAVMVAEQILQSIDAKRWYRDASAIETGPHVRLRESVRDASRRAHQQKRAA